jgi:hypothetical protein
MLHDIIKLEPGEVAKIDQPESWEERFDRRFHRPISERAINAYHDPSSRNVYLDLSDIKDFIRQELADQRSQLLVDWFGDNYPNTIEKLK